MGYELKNEIQKFKAEKSSEWKDQYTYGVAVDSFKAGWTAYKLLTKRKQDANIDQMHKDLTEERNQLEMELKERK